MNEQHTHQHSASCDDCGGTGSVPADASAMVDGTDDDGHAACPSCNADAAVVDSWEPTFGPLESYLRWNPSSRERDGWEYMGTTHEHGKALYHYRRRARVAIAPDQHIVLTPSGYPQHIIGG
jgi:hypothetical protein